MGKKFSFVVRMGDTFKIDRIIRSKGDADRAIEAVRTKLVEHKVSDKILKWEMDGFRCESLVENHSEVIRCLSNDLVTYMLAIGMVAVSAPKPRLAPVAARVSPAGKNQKVQLYITVIDWDGIVFRMNRVIRNSEAAERAICDFDTNLAAVPQKITRSGAALDLRLKISYRHADSPFLATHIDYIFNRDDCRRAVETLQEELTRLLSLKIEAPAPTPTASRYPAMLREMADRLEQAA